VLDVDDAPSCATGLTVEVEKARNAARRREDPANAASVSPTGEGKGMKRLNFAPAGSRVAIRHHAESRQAALHERPTTMLNLVHETRARALQALAVPQHAPFKAAPVLLPDPTDPKREDRRKTHMTAVASYLYINRLPGNDRLGPLPDAYLSKADDLVCTGRRHPVQNTPVALRTGRQIWDEADMATSRDLEHASAVHVILTLPDIPEDEWQHLVETFIDENLVKVGIVSDYAIHAKRDDSGQGWATHPHAHLLCTARRWKSDQRKGQRMTCWLHNKAQLDAIEAAWLAASGLSPVPFKLG